jgi:hypothetical protein
MAFSDSGRHFLAIWRRALNEPSLDRLTPELISFWAAERGLAGVSAEERDVGAFAKTKSVVLTVGDKKGCFPKIPAAGNPEWEVRRGTADQVGARWEKVEWFAPLWVPNYRIIELLAEVRHCSRQRALELFNLSYFNYLYTFVSSGMHCADNANGEEFAGVLPPRAGGLPCILLWISSIEHLGSNTGDRRGD